MKSRADWKRRMLWGMCFFAAGFLTGVLGDTYLPGDTNKWVRLRQIEREREKALERKIEQTRDRSDRLRKKLGLPSDGK